MLHSREAVTLLGPGVRRERSRRARPGSRGYQSPVMAALYLLTRAGITVPDTAADMEDDVWRHIPDVNVNVNGAF